MAATALSVQPAVNTGLDIVYSTPTQTTGHTAPCGAGVALLIKNSTGGLTVTVYTPGTVDGLAISDRSVVIATGGKDYLIPLPATLYADPTTGLATFDLSATANTTMACVRIS